MKKIIVVTVLLVIAIIVALYLLSQGNANLSEAELRERFRCDRVTADELATDIYCQNPTYYYDDAEKGAVIGPSDFEDPRYKAMYDN